MKLDLAHKKALGAAVLATLLGLGSLAAQDGPFAAIGTGCAGSRGIPELTVTGDHMLGGSTTVHVDNLPPGMPGILLIGKARRFTPLDFGNLGCRLHIDAAHLRTIALPTGSGRVAHTERYPQLDPRGDFLGEERYFQFAALDVLMASQVIVSNAVAILIGERHPDGYPEGFTPLGPSFMAQRCEELAALVIGDGRVEAALAFDDADTGANVAMPGSLASALPRDFTITDTATAEWDPTPADPAAPEWSTVPARELFVVGRTSSDAIEVHVLRLVRDPNGGDPEWSRIESFVASDDSPLLAHEDIQVVAADVDADGADEVVVAAAGPRSRHANHQEGWVRVFDMAVRRRAIHHVEVTGWHASPELRLRVLAGNLDEDRHHELFVAAGGRYLVVEDADVNFARRGGWGYCGSNVVIGNFDEDAQEEIAAVGVDGNHGIDGQAFDVRPDGSLWPVTGGWSSSRFRSAWSPHFPGIDEVLIGNVSAARTCDADGDGIDEVVVALTAAHRPLRWVGSEPWTVSHYLVVAVLDGPRRAMDPGPWIELAAGPERHSGSSNPGLDFAPFALAVCDDDRDGFEEIYAGTLETDGVSFQRFEVPGVLDRESGEVHPLHNRDPQLESAGAFAATTAVPPSEDATLLLAAADFDADSVIWRYVPRSHTTVYADPMPVAVLAAPPTKAGIDQNRAESITRFGQVSSNERMTGTTYGRAVTTSGGLDLSAYGLGISGKHTVEKYTQRTYTRTTRVATERSYATGYWEDAVVFYRTLYQQHQYEVVAAPNPDVLGQRITLSDPIESQMLKWPLAVYNLTYEHARIDESVLRYTPEENPRFHVHEVEAARQLPFGDPNSYFTEQRAQELNREAFRFESASQITMFTRTNGATNGQTVNLRRETSTATSYERTVTHGTENEAGFSIGGASASYAWGRDKGKLYGFTLENGSFFEGEIGEIESRDWNAENYKAGLLVYKHGVDGDGRALHDQRQFFVVTYFVDQGTGAVR